MIEFYFRVSNARPDQQKPRLRLGFAKVGPLPPKKPRLYLGFGRTFFLIELKLEMLQHIQIRKKSISKFHFPVKLYEIRKNVMIQYYFLHKDLQI